jgi:1,4-alpha-glucan branching enzyme
MANRHQHNALDKPYSVYEVHLGSWARSPESPDQFLTYTELAHKLVPYVKEMGFTHVEFMPIMEHPYYPSWGYQISGYFAAASRYGSPQELMYLIEEFHKAGIGVILDWVPSHFPGDIHALYKFDGTHLYEHEDMRKGFHPDWKSYIFNYGRNEVRAFLISNALFWLDRYHADGLRVDAVASMLYLDYSRNHGEWEPNIYGGNENLEAISFLKEFNEAVYSHFPSTQTIAEESTSFTGVSRPVYLGGLRFWHEMDDGLDARYHRLFSKKILSIVNIIITKLLLAPYTPLPKTLCCLSRTMRWYTAKVACCAKCRAMSGSSLPTCA